MKKLLLFIITLFILLPQANAQENEGFFGDNTKTIKELKQEIKEIEENEKNLEDELSNFLQENSIKDYIRLPLTQVEISKIRTLVYNYKYKKERVDKLIKINSNVQNLKILKDELIKLKLSFYNDIAPFIAPEQYEKYIQYITSESNYHEEKKVIKASKIQTKDLMNKKVEILEEKIKEHKSALAEKIRKTAEEKIDKKIEQLAQNPDFQKLNLDIKARVVEKTIEKVDEKIEKIETLISKNDQLFVELLKQKREIYHISKDKLEEFHGSIIAQK